MIGDQRFCLVVSLPDLLLWTSRIRKIILEIEKVSRRKGTKAVK